MCLTCDIILHHFKVELIDKFDRLNAPDVY
jgi:hypothetical protein